jgi:hypothetical protein
VAGYFAGRSINVLTENLTSSYGGAVNFENSLSGSGTRASSAVRFNGNGCRRWWWTLHGQLWIRYERHRLQLHP